MVPPLKTRFFQIVTPDDDISASDNSEILHLVNADEPHEVGHGVSIGAAGRQTGQSGEPFGFRRHVVGQTLELGCCREASGRRLQGWSCLHLILDKRCHPSLRCRIIKDTDTKNEIFLV
jgi:hypothetical protein